MAVELQDRIDLTFKHCSKQKESPSIGFVGLSLLVLLCRLGKYSLMLRQQAEIQCTEDEEDFQASKKSHVVVSFNRLRYDEILAFESNYGV